MRNWISGIGENLVDLVETFVAVAIFMVLAQTYRPARTNPTACENQDIAANLAVESAIF